MPYNAYRPKPGRHGVFVVYVAAGPVTLTSAATDNIRFATPFRKCYFLGASALCTTVLGGFGGYLADPAHFAFLGALSGVAAGVASIIAVQLKKVADKISAPPPPPAA